MLDDFEHGLRRFTVAGKDREKGVQNLSLPGLVAFPSRRGTLPHGEINLDGKRRLGLILLGALEGVPRKVRQIVEENDSLVLPMQTVAKLFAPGPGLSKSLR